MSLQIDLFQHVTASSWMHTILYSQCWRRCYPRYETLRQHSRKQHLLCSTGPSDCCPEAEPQEQSGLTLYTLASWLQKQKARSNLYMVIFTFIGYFILVLCNFSLPHCLGFISLLCHFYLPATLSGLKPTLFFFLILLPATLPPL
jgi:hypothetical protein